MLEKLKAGPVPGMYFVRNLKALSCLNNSLELRGPKMAQWHFRIKIGGKGIATDLSS